MDDPRTVLVACGALTVAAWKWWPLWQQQRRSRTAPAGQPTSTCLVNVLAFAGGWLLAGWAGPLLAAGASSAAALVPAALLDTAPLAVTLVVLAACLEVGCRGLGLWPRQTCPRLIHGPLAALLPAVVVAAWPLFGQAAEGLREVAPEASAAETPTVACAGGQLPGEVAGFREVQLAHAADIVAAGREWGVPEQAQVIAVATAMQESSLRVLANPTVPASLDLPHDGVGSDHDSVGLFQQRQGWGPTAVLMDPRGSARLFYASLTAIDWRSLSLTQAAQAVQRSAHPDRYARWEDPARAIVTAVTTTCTAT